MTTNARGPQAFELTPQRLADLGSLAERVHGRADLPALIRVSTADDGRGLEAEVYFARGGRVLPGFRPKTSS